MSDIRDMRLSHVRIYIVLWSLFKYEESPNIEPSTISSSPNSCLSSCYASVLQECVIEIESVQQGYNHCQKPSMC